MWGLNSNLGVKNFFFEALLGIKSFPVVPTFPSESSKLNFSKKILIFLGSRITLLRWGSAAPRLVSPVSSTVSDLNVASRRSLSNAPTPPPHLGRLFSVYLAVEAVSPLIHRCGVVLFKVRESWIRTGPADGPPNRTMGALPIGANRDQEDHQILWHRLGALWDKSIVLFMPVVLCIVLFVFGLLTEDRIIIRIIRWWIIQGEIVGGECSGFSVAKFFVVGRQACQGRGRLTYWHN